MNSVRFDLFKSLKGNFLCRGENKNFQLETLSVYERPLWVVCGVCLRRQKMHGTALSSLVIYNVQTYFYMLRE